MTHRKHCIFIEGFPYCWGTAKPSWSNATLLDGLTNPQEIELEQKIDPFGGIAEFNDLDITLSDSKYKLSDIFRFYDSNSVEVSTRPILDTTTQVSLSTSLHGTAKALKKPTAATILYINPKDGASLQTDTWTHIYHVKRPTTVPRSEYGYMDRTGGAGSFSGIITFMSGSSTRHYISDGTNQYIHSTSAIPANQWVCVAFRYDGTRSSIYFNGSWSHLNMNPVGPSRDYPTVLGWDGTTTNSGIEYAKYMIYTSALSDEDVEALCDCGRIDTSPELYYDMTPYNGKVLLDQSGNDHHGYIGFDTYTFEDRTLVCGDKLYAPRNTWNVTDLSGAVATIQQAQYPCTSAPNAFYYDRNQIDDYTCLAYFDGPRAYQNRMISYYRDDGEGFKLEWLGYISQIAQLGTSWNIRAKHVLNSLRDSIKPGEAYLPLGADIEKQWQIQYVSVFWGEDANYAFYTWAPPADEYFTRSSWCSRFNDWQGSEVTANGPIWRAGVNSGLVYYGSPMPILLDKAIAHGTYEALFDSMDKLQIKDGVAQPVSTIYGVKNYGLIAGNNFLVSIDGNAPGIYTDKWVKIGSKLFYIAGTDTYTRPGGQLGYQVRLEGAYECDSLELSLGWTAGTSSNDPIVLEIVPVIEANSVPQLVYTLLTSTGDLANNGQFDTLGGWLGMGINDDYLDSTILQMSTNNHKVFANIDGATIGNELEAFGYAFVFENERFKIVSVKPPVLQESVASITDDDLSFGEKVNLNWGYYQPLNFISYAYSNKGQDYEYRYSVTTDDTFASSQNNEKSWKSDLNYYIEDVESFSRLQQRRLQWYSNYVPTAEIVIPGNRDIEVGQTITLNLDQCAGEGWYGITNVPAIVVAKKDDYTYRVVINTSPAAQRALWCPGWIIESYSGSTLTIKGDTTWLESNDFPDDNKATIYTGDWRADLETKILSYSSSTITVSGSPTYNQDLYSGYITFRNYTDYASQTTQDGYVWASDDSGAMSDSDEGKKLY